MIEYGWLRRAVSSQRWLGVADQAIASLSNILVVVFVGRYDSPRELGWIAIALAYWNVVLAIVRGLVGESLQVTDSGSASDGMRATLAAALVSFLPPAVYCLISSVGSTRETSFVALVLALGLPSLLIQDYWRWYAFRERRAHAAILNDILFLLVQIAVLAGSLAFGPSVSGATSLLAWVIGGTAGAVLGFRQFGCPRMHIARPSFDWVRRNARVATAIMAEGAMRAFVSLLFVILATFVAGPGPVGVYRAMQTLIGPGNIVVAGVISVSLAPARDLVRSGGGIALSRSLHRGGAIMIAAALLYGVIVVMTLPLLSRQIFGKPSDWLAAVGIPVALQFVATAGLVVPLIAVRAIHRIRPLLVTRLISAVVGFALALVTLRHGSEASVGWAALVVTGLSTLGTWLAYLWASSPRMSRP